MAHSYRPHWTPDAVVYDLQHFRDWMFLAKQGERCLYHVGQMLVDQEKSPKLKELGDYAALMSDFGALVLVQKRAKESMYQYFAARTDHAIRMMPKRASQGEVSVTLFKILSGINDRAENISVRRAIRNSISCSEELSGKILRDLIDGGFLIEGRPPQLTGISRWYLS